MIPRSPSAFAAGGTYLPQRSSGVDVFGVGSSVTP